MSTPQTRPAAPKPDAPKTVKQLSARPFVYDGLTPAAPRAWRPSAAGLKKNPDQITVALGSIVARIAGSVVTFNMDVNLVFPDKTSKELILRKPYITAPGGFGGAELFKTDDAESGKLFAESLAAMLDSFITDYEKIPADQRIDVRAIDHDAAAKLISVRAGAVKKTI